MINIFIVQHSETEQLELFIKVHLKTKVEFGVVWLTIFLTIGFDLTGRDS